LGNLLLQERGSYSKVGEKHGYFGGNIERGEKPKDALIRELKEELNYTKPGGRKNFLAKSLKEHCA